MVYRQCFSVTIDGRDHWLRPLSMADLLEADGLDDEVSRAAFLVQRCLVGDPVYQDLKFLSPREVLEGLDARLFNPLVEAITSHATGEEVDHSPLAPSPSSSPSEGESPSPKPWAHRLLKFTPGAIGGFIPRIRPNAQRG